MRVGLTYGQAQDIPFGELLDFVAIEQIKAEGFRHMQNMTRDEEIIPDVR